MNVIKNITLEYNMSQSQVKSQISDKVYESTLDDLYEFDQGAEVDLYKINIFNKNICIAPGRVISEPKRGVYYSYVYAIKNDKVVAKLGVYEKNTTQDEIFDLSKFEEGSFLLFDYYYNEPTSMVEFEMKDEMIHIFDYLKNFIKTSNNATAEIMKQNKLISKLLIDLKVDPEYKAILKTFKINRPYDNDFLDSLKNIPMNMLVFVLCILEHIFKIKFIFTDEDGDKYEAEERTMVPEVKEPQEYIEVSLGDPPLFIKKMGEEPQDVEVEQEEEQEQEEVEEEEQEKVEVEVEESESEFEEEIEPVVKSKYKSETNENNLGLNTSSNSNSNSNKEKSKKISFKQSPFVLKTTNKMTESKGSKALMPEVSKVSESKGSKPKGFVESKGTKPFISELSELSKVSESKSNKPKGFKESKGSKPLIPKVSEKIDISERKPSIASIPEVAEQKSITPSIPEKKTKSSRMQSKISISSMKP